MEAVIFCEDSLAPTDRLFAAAVEHLASKLGRVKPLAADSIPDDRVEALAALHEWADGAVSTWEQELARFYEDHLAVYVRPDPQLNAVVRDLHARGITVAAWSPGPPEAFAVLAHHLGLSRSLTTVSTDPVGPLAVVEALGLPTAKVVIVSRDARTRSAASGEGVPSAASALELRLPAV
jgi:phosphoglycolate phosphatase-like HAD superfamily hydrolase